MCSLWPLPDGALEIVMCGTDYEDEVALMEACPAA
jgi:hypothetical protein